MRDVSGPALGRVNHDIRESIASFSPGSQITSISLDLSKPLLSARFVGGTENKGLTSDVQHLKGVFTVRVGGYHTVRQTDGLP